MSNYLTIKEFAKAINKSNVWVWFLIKSKKIKARKYEGKYKIEISELGKYKEAAALKRRIQKEEWGEDINEHIGEEKPKEPKEPKYKYKSRWWFKKKYYQDKEDEERQEKDIDYKHFKR